jgi:DNA-binding winged helix-turn-helix (wHTH) protein
MRYEFGGVVIDADAYELRSNGRLVVVEPQVFEVLVHLLLHRDRVVSKEELLDEVWGDRFVSESALTTRIKQARHAVGDNRQDQRVIKTVHGRGYRFIAPVTETPSAGLGQDQREDSDTPEAVRLIERASRTRYLVNDGASIAFQVFGEGPDLVLIEGFATNVEVQREHPAIAGFLRRLGAFCRVAVLDKRGVGLSDRLGPGEVPSLERHAEDVQASSSASRGTGSCRQPGSTAETTHRVGMPAAIAAYDEPVRRTATTATATARSGGIAGTMPAPAVLATTPPAASAPNEAGTTKVVARASRAGVPMRSTSTTMLSRNR